MHNISTMTWVLTVVGILGLFALDFLKVDSHPHHFSTKEATRWVLFYIVLALLFGAFVWSYFGANYAQEFLAGWITEYSLSVDNLFVFIVLMSSFSVPDHLKHRVLLIGVALAIILRGLMIAVGAQAIQRFQGTFFVFAAFLLYTAITIWKSDEEEVDPEGNAIIRFMEKRFSFTRDYHESKLSIRKEGKRYLTPMFLVVIAVGTTDVLFALDSIPAVFGLTKQPYIVFTANAFALMGLRQLYFLLDGLLERIIYLSKGLAVILSFIAVKLFLEAGHSALHWHVPTISIGQSLMFILLTLTVTVIVSLRSAKQHPELVDHSEIHLAKDEAAAHEGEAIGEIPNS